MSCVARVLRSRFGEGEWRSRMSVTELPASRHAGTVPLGPGDHALGSSLRPDFLNTIFIGTSLHGNAFRSEFSTYRM